MSRVRPLRAEDLPALADLWIRAFRRPGTPAGVQRYFREVFLDAPLSSDDAESLVHEDPGGAVTGFIGALPRRMVFRGRAIRAVAATQLMVDPGRRRGFAAFELLRALFAGPQELTFSDGGNERSQHVWERSGGEVSRLYSLDWRRILRPAGYLRQRIDRAGGTRVAQGTAHLCRAFDAASARLGFFESAAAVGVPLGKPSAALAEEDFATGPVRKLMEQSGQSLRPSHDDASLARLLEQAARTRGHGPLRARLCRDAWGDAIGWYVHYAKPDGTSQVLQFGGKSRAIGDVLGNLFADAYAAGSVAVIGQAEPRWLREITDAHATFRCRCLGVLVHSRDREILGALQRGDAALSRLDGEWWLRFGADPLVD